MADKTACGGTQCVVDNRQQNHAWGPWMWVQGGTYAEPLMSDEQPGSWMFFEADLHTDRLSGNRQREVAYSYRQLEFCPPESLPGFAFHQTDRDPSPKQAAICPDGRCANASRVRDFDLLGHRYSLLSSIATGGLNNVVCYLPARDSEEFEHLPADEIAFVRTWLDFTDRHTSALKKTRALPGSAAKPSFGAIDGTAMIDDDAKSGFVFLFNPSSFELVYNLTLDETIGFTCDDIGTPLVLLARILTSTASIEFKPYHLDLVACGEVLSVAVPPTTALALMLESWWPSAVQRRAATIAQKRQLPYLEAHDPSDFLVLGVMETDAASYDPATKVLSVHAMGEAGTAAVIHVVLPAAMGAQDVATVLVNGVHVAFTASPYFGAPAVHISGQWGTQPRFGRSQQLCGPKSPSASLGGHGHVQWQCTFTVPAAMSQQLAQRNASFALDYDLDPQSNNEANVAWLAPGRLLVWLKYRSLMNDTLNVSGTIDGTPLLVRKAYNTIVPRSDRFIGHFADVTPLVKFGQQQTMALTLPAVGGWTTKPGALTAGSDVAQLQSVAVSEAQAACSASEVCVGLTFRKPSGVASCAALPSSTKMDRVYLKMTTAGNDDSEWCTMLEPPTPVGIFFENVETIYEQSFTQPVEPTLGNFESA